MKYIYSFIGFLLLTSCSSTLKTSYGKLSSAEKTWVVFHVFKAKKAYAISLEAEEVTDSIKIKKIIGNDISGGKLDAFKHSYWMARLTQDIGKRSAFSLGKAHEKGNYQTYKKRQLEDGLLPDKPSTDMDLFNNQIGISIGNKFNEFDGKSLVKVIIDSIRQGKMKIIVKDNKGNFLDCQNKIIPLDSLKGKWDTNKCLGPSNYNVIVNEE